jgi:hypothetical protein
MDPDARPLPEPPPPLTPAEHVRDPMIDEAPSTRRVLIAVAIALVLIVVAIVVGRQLLADAADVDPTYRHLVTNLGDGWRVVAAKDEGVNTGPPFPGAVIVLLGTKGDPTRPAIELVWRTDDGAPTFENLAASTGMSPIVTTTGRAASCSSVPDGTTLCYVDERHQGLQLRANHVSLAEITQVVDAITFVDDAPRIDTTVLPADLQQLASGRLGDIGLVPNGNADHPGVSSVLYAGPGDASALLVVGDAGRQEPASSAVTLNWERRTFDGGKVFVSTSTDGSIAMWHADGQAYWLRIAGADVDTVLAAAASVRPATAAEWSALPARPQWDQGVAVTG